MLLQSARLGMAIRKEYARLKVDPAAKFYTYVLQLQDGKFYVGNTDNIYARMLDHHTMSPSSALWVKHFGPVQRIVEVSRNSAKADEHYKTLQYMSMFGWENVRGSSYCKVQMFGPPEGLKTFSRTREGEFEYFTPQEVEALEDAIKELQQVEESI